MLSNDKVLTFCKYTCCILILQNSVVTICASRLIIQKLNILPKDYISLEGNERLLLYREKGTPFCEAETLFLNIMWLEVSSKFIELVFEVQRDYKRTLPQKSDFNLSKPTGYLMHQQFNIQQLYLLTTLYLCVLYLSENKQRLVPLTA